MLALAGEENNFTWNYFINHCLKHILFQGDVLIKCDRRAISAP